MEITSFFHKTSKKAKGCRLRKILRWGLCVKTIKLQAPSPNHRDYFADGYNDNVFAACVKVKNKLLAQLSVAFTDQK